MVLAEARTLAQGIDGLRAKVKGLLDGLEAEIDLAVDVMLPAQRLATVLAAFAEAFPTVSLRLHVEALGAVTALVLDRKAPGHPLARMGQIPAEEVRNHCQLVLTDRSGFTEGQDFAVLSPRTWRVADLGAKHALLREGIGWGFMPLPLVRPDLEGGSLPGSPFPATRAAPYRFRGIWRRDTPPGPAASWLLDHFAALGAGDVEEKGFSDI